MQHLFADHILNYVYVYYLQKHVYHFLHITWNKYACDKIVIGH